MYLCEECVTKWKLTELCQIIDSFEDNCSDYIKKNHIKSSNDYDNILIFSAAKTILTFREILVLCSNGFSDGALSLARNLYEQFINVRFFDIIETEEDFQLYIEDYYTNQRIQTLKKLKFEAEFLKDNNRETDILKELEEEKRKAHSQIEISKDYWWARKNNFKDMISDVISNEPDEIKSMLYYLHLFYKRACVSLHASGIGNSIRLGAESTRSTIDTRPNSNGQALPLYISTVSFLYIGGKISSRFETDFNNEIKKLNELIEYYTKEIFKFYT